MSRLLREFSRLYLPAPGSYGGPECQGRLRALVLELSHPSEWSPLAAVWQGVQADLGLPAPAIAVNGADGMQLWFSVVDALQPERADAFLDALCRRYLPDLPRSRWRHAPAEMPSRRESSGCWSAFLAADLAVLFAETPWLDLAPNEDGQADLLASLSSIEPALFDAAMAQLQSPAAAGSAAAGGTAPPLPDQCAQAARLFLSAVMNDASAPLALRIEAAKALLPRDRP